MELFRALGSRNYRLFFAGQSISLVGTWMQTIAMSWLVYRLSHSAFMLGLVGFAGDLPGFILMPFAGVFADRIDRRRVIVWTQLFAMLQAILLAALVFTDAVRIWHVLALSILLGVVNAFDMPSRQAFVVEMIDKKEDLANAIALNSSIFNLARLVGPSIAGILIALAGEGVCFLLNGLSYLAVVAALLAMKVETRKAPVVQGSHLKALREGLGYSYRFVPIRNILLLLTLISIMGTPYAVLMPIFADSILHGGSHALGFLMGAAGLGALTGALRLASRKTVLGLGRLIPFAAGVFSAGMIGVALSRSFVLSLLIMILLGYGLMTMLASCNTLVQTLVDEEKRGRVMGIYAMAVRGIAPLGSLVVGSLASQIGAPGALLAGGILCGAGALVFARELPAMRRIMRPIYVRSGIIPEMARGLRSANEAGLPPEEEVRQ